MKIRTLIFSGTMALAPLMGCKGTVPQDSTSLVLDPGANPGPPQKKLTLNWMHHSTGNNLLDGGLRRALEANNIEFYDMYYGEGKVDQYIIGDHTDPPDFPTNFNTPTYFEVIKRWELKDDKKQHDIIMFKSCFPASNIQTDEMLEDYKKWYNSMLPTFSKHPDILFIPFTTPPLIKNFISKAAKPDRAARARAFAKWLTTEYAQDQMNVQSFDLFNALAIGEGKPNENTLVPQFARGWRDSHVEPPGAQAMTRLFIPWLNRAIRRAGLSD